jgi:hypothetical protein
MGKANAHAPVISLAREGITRELKSTEMTTTN